MSEDSFTDSRGVLLKDTKSNLSSTGILYDAWVDAAHQHSDYGWLGFVEATGPHEFYACPWQLPGSTLGPYWELEDATLTLLTWYKLRMEQGLWES